MLKKFFFVNVVVVILVIKKLFLGFKGIIFKRLWFFVILLSGVLVVR